LVALITLLVLLLPPAGSIVVLYAFFRWRRKKNKKIGFVKSQALSIPFSFLSSQWMTLVINHTRWFGVPDADINFLMQFKDAVDGLPFLDIIPLEYRLPLVMAVLIYVALLPA
jgi:hypothetical protein